MTATTLLSRVYRVYRGKISSKTPAWASDKANIVLDIANQKTEEFEDDTKQKWASLFRSTSPNEVGTVATTGTTALTGTNTYFTDYESGDKVLVDGETVRTIDAIASDTSLTVTVAFTNTDSAKTFTRTPIIKTGLQEYTLNRKFIMPSDEVIVSITTQDIPYVTKRPQDRQNGDVYFWGSDPKKVSFYADIESTNQAVGGELIVPGYYRHDALSAATDLVKIDNPNYLVYAIAAELSRNDPAKESQFANLFGIANDLYSKMSDANQEMGFKQDNTVPYDMPAIGSTE